MSNHLHLLRSLGLNESEAQIYLTSLESGPASPQDLMKRSGFSRPSTYAAIDALMTKGLLTSQRRGKRHLYVAEPPERLVGYAESQAKMFDAKVREMASAVPDLNLLQHGERPSVKFYEGAQGLQAILQEIASSHAKETLEISNLDAVKNVFTGEDLQHIQKILSKQKTKGRALFVGTVTRVRPGVEARILPKDEFDFSGDIVVYGNRIAMVTFTGKIIGAVIENNILADTYRALFKLAWMGAEKYPNIS